MKGKGNRPSFHTRSRSSMHRGAPVVAGDGLVVGIVSEVDVFTKKGKLARDIMSPNVITVTEDTGIDEAARLMGGERIRRVPVIKRGKMVGLLSRSDVLDFFAKTRWTCNVCGRWERGLERPERCFSCSSTDIRLERARTHSIARITFMRRDPGQILCAARGTGRSVRGLGTDRAGAQRNRR